MQIDIQMPIRYIERVCISFKDNNFLCIQKINSKKKQHNQHILCDSTTVRRKMENIDTIFFYMKVKRVGARTEGKFIKTESYSGK